MDHHALNLSCLKRSLSDVATTDDGAWKLPDGDAYYRHALRKMTTTDLSPDAIHELGLSEVKRIHDEMRAIMRKVDFEGSLQEFFEFTRDDPQFYDANLYDMKEMPIYQMEALAYHEGIPGHHMQLSLAQELEGVPRFRKFGLRFTAYTEGWGLYTELIPKEIGCYADPYSDFGRLSMELWRAARLVVDTGIHDKRWTRGQAIDYLMDNTPNQLGDCRKAIERYIVMPGQATAYKIGMLKILELRESARERLGERFDLREFHDVILRDGPMPLTTLEERVESWVNTETGQKRLPFKSHTGQLLTRSPLVGSKDSSS